MERYIVKKPFTNYGKIYTAGSLIDDPASIKRIKSKVRNRDIVIVTEQTLALWRQYFRANHRVDIMAYFKAEQAKVSAAVKTTDEQKTVPVAKVVSDVKDTSDDKSENIQDTKKLESAVVVKEV